jgi:peptidyl-prolyl cis-trans isomerase C
MRYASHGVRRRVAPRRLSKGAIMHLRWSFIAGFGIVVAFGLTGWAAEPPSVPAAPSHDPVVARIDGVELHLSDVEAARQNLAPQARKLPLAAVYPALLDRLVNTALLAEAGRKAHLDQTPQVAARLRRLQDSLIAQIYLTKAIDSAMNEEQLKARYQALAKAKASEEEVHARHILVKTQAEAEKIIGELDKGADFAALAKKYSTDPSNAQSGGDLGYFTRDQMVPAFSAAAFALPVGSYTKKPVKTEFGWHVIKVEDRRKRPPPSFEEARPELEKQIASEVIDKALKELRGAAKIETFGPDGKPLPQEKH